jgi:hypothetical protein
VTLPGGCHGPPDALWVDTARILTGQLWRRGVPVGLGIMSFLDPVQPAFHW